MLRVLDSPAFRLMDDYASQALAISGRNGSFAPRSFRTFQPSFDVRETSQGYELHGELPGIDQKNIEIEFTVTNTLSIKGRTETVRERGQRPAASGPVEDQAEQARVTEGSENAESTNYHKPTVEDESAMSNTNPNAVQTSEAAKKAAESTEVTQSERQPESDSSRYWLSERRNGHFARSWTFPTHVDQENVKASLKNGILSIVVPKAQAPQTRRINIE